MHDAYLYDGIRTPFGRHGGALAGVRPDDLLGLTLKHLIERSSFANDTYEEVLAGCTNQAGEDSRNVARHAALLAGLPIEVAGQTVNRLCGSGLAAILDAARATRNGEGELFLAGGVESMSRAPYVLGKADSAYARNQPLYDTVIGSRFPNPWLAKEYGSHSMPETADNVAHDLEIDRTAADAYAARSQARYAEALASGFYTGELLPVEVPQGRKQPPLLVDQDEHPRPGSDADKLGRLPALFENGVVSAGNASGLNDGAAAMIVGSLAAGEKAGMTPRGRIVSGAVAGVAPRVMGLGPVPSSQKALARAGLTMEQMDLIEINEAFAVQVLGCVKQLGLSADDSRLNPNGGAIAIGHPLGASGARLALTALRQLEATGGRYALVTMCIGVGQGIAAVIERFE
ncbi:acetyl-CoA C-acetyltransferase [Modicisalibacter ilicicola DSM 19980]|uniref:Acetyl-CoA C-acetyltransferase n=1 Tax=Modicisalibacter ilicicola DSM 19980 TaxID=1121942 RepID=A0A1M4WJU6_9GAMM|nr:3-oxoadipyl-CoA thiolase [Halomonas ilicicola]SHE81508.1 acetyl-CoA C-acetyltransferase [Halomonas ilicicola DSM 19980]